MAVFLEAFNAAWAIGLASFGVHLGLPGLLTFRTGFMPRILGSLLFLAGAAYVVDTFANALLPN